MRRVKADLIEKVTRLHPALAPHYCFLGLALLLHLFYAFKTFPLSDYPHGAERFLHSISISYRVIGGGDSAIPAEYVQFAYISHPVRIRKMYGEQIPGWRRQLQNEAFLTSEAGQCQAARRNKEQFSLLRCSTGANRATGIITDFKSAYSAAEYNAVGYLPYMIGMIPGLALGAPPLVIYALSQFTNIAFLLGLAFFTLRALPVLKWPVLVLLLLPSMFTMRSFYMPDALAIELSYLMLALVLRSRMRAEPLGRCEQGILAAVALCLSLIKVVFFIIPFLLFLLPPTALGSRFKKNVFAATLVLAGIAAAGLWNVHAADAHYPLQWEAVWDKSVPLPPQQPGLRINERFAGQLLHAPQTVAHNVLNNWVTLRGMEEMLYNTVLFNRYVSPEVTPHYAKTFSLFLAFGLFFIVLFGLSAAELRRAKFCLSGREKLLIAAILVSTALLISAIIYIFWGSAQIDGKGYARMLQGRYFLPLLPFALLLAARGELKEGGKDTLLTRQSGWIISIFILLCFHYNYLSYF